MSKIRHCDFQITNVCPSPLAHEFTRKRQPLTPPDKQPAAETLEEIADRIAYRYLDKAVGSAKLKSDILSALRNERERAVRIIDEH